jgi:hypothetical protein
MFESGKFTLHSGGKNNFRINCASLTWIDLAALAEMVAPKLKPFGQVYGIPRGGVRFSQALGRYRTTGPRLVVDDVFTTGASMEDEHTDGDQGLVIFSRVPWARVPEWIYPIFTADL